MKYFSLLLLPLLCLTCTKEEPGIFGSNTTITRLAVYNFDVDIDIVPGEDTFSEFTPTDSTMILQITRTVDTDLNTTGDESYETIYIVVSNDLQTLEISGDDWDDVKSFAFTNERTVNAPLGRVTGGTITGSRLNIDNSWVIDGTVTISEDFGPTFPLELTGTFASR
jgi:hypothetical protein